MPKGVRHRAVPQDQHRAMPRRGAANEGRACRSCLLLLAAASGATGTAAAIAQVEARRSETACRNSAGHWLLKKIPATSASS
jgi:hypothetical protein